MNWSRNNSVKDKIQKRWTRCSKECSYDILLQKSVETSSRQLGKLTRTECVDALALDYMVW